MREDHDCDGVDELFLSNGTLQAVLRDDGLAAIVELDAYALAQNFGDTLRRHAESYHRAIAAGDAREAPSEGIASAHDRVAYRHRIDAADLVPDARARALFVDALEAPDGTVATIGDYALAGDSAPRPCAHFRATRAGAAIDKRVALRDERVHVAYALAGGLAGRWRVEMDLAMPSCDGVGGRFIHDGAIRGGFGDTHAIDATDHVRLDDTFMGGSVDLRCSPRARRRAALSHRVPVRAGLREDHAVDHADAVLGARRRARRDRRVARDRAPRRVALLGRDRARQPKPAPVSPRSAAARAAPPSARSASPGPRSAAGARRAPGSPLRRAPGPG